MRVPWPDDRSLGAVVVIVGGVNLVQTSASLLRGVPVVWRLVTAFAAEAEPQ
jgi:hypothetical protein